MYLLGYFVNRKSVNFIDLSANNTRFRLSILTRLGKNMILLPGLFMYCTVEKAKVIGNWQAVEFYEWGKPMAINLDSVQMDFSEDGRYQFRSSAYYSESGLFAIKGKFITLRDTTGNEGDKTKTMIISEISESRIKLDMEKEGKKQELIFERKGALKGN